MTNGVDQLSEMKSINIIIFDWPDILNPDFLVAFDSKVIKR